MLLNLQEMSDQHIRDELIALVKSGGSKIIIDLGTCTIDGLTLTISGRDNLNCTFSTIEELMHSINDDKWFQAVLDWKPLTVAQKSTMQDARGDLIKVVRDKSGNVYGVGQCTITQDELCPNLLRMTVGNRNYFFLWRSDEHALRTFQDDLWMNGLLTGN